MSLKKVDELRFYSRELIREFGFLDTPYEQYDVNFAQIHVLLECDRYGTIDQRTLAQNLRVNKSYISRLVKKLINQKLLVLLDNAIDGRIRSVMLTPLGNELVQKINNIENKRVFSALRYLSDADQITVKEGLQQYSQALKKVRKLEGVIIRPIELKDNAALSALIKTVLIEFGANKPGFAFSDPETNAMFEAYQGQGRGYFVAQKDNVIIGGIGFGELHGADLRICELRKMYLMKEARGLGLGDELLRLVMNESKKNYSSIYLETLSSMTQAISLYRRHQFDFLPAPMGDTGHFNCDTWMIKNF